jgi:hypothetical protein
LVKIEIRGKLVRKKYEKIISMTLKEVKQFPENHTFHFPTEGAGK